MNGWTWKSNLRTLCAGLCGGAVLAAGCSNEEVQLAVLAGVQTAAGQLADGSNNNDISFLDWVNSELDN